MVTRIAGSHTALVRLRPTGRRAARILPALEVPRD
jgi:hypothetical protein